MSDGSSKTLMVDERQTVGEVLDRLFEKTYCDGSVDWSLCETHPKLQTGEMSEHTGSAWTKVVDVWRKKYIKYLRDCLTQDALLKKFRCCAI